MQCRMCSRADQTINNIVSKCPKLALKEYKRRHDWIGRRIQWDICGANGTHVKPKWYEHQPEIVNENENESCKILWDFAVQRYNFITAGRLDMIFTDKEHHECQINDQAILYDTRVDYKGVEKIEKYLDLARELKNVGNMKLTVVPLVAGAQGTPARALEKRLKVIDIEKKIAEL